MTSENVLGSGTKCDTSEPDSPKVDNVCFSYFTTNLNNLCKPATILFADSSAPIHSVFSWDDAAYIIYETAGCI